MPRDKIAIIQTIRLEPRKLAAVLEEIREAEQKGGINSKRESDRVWINKQIVVSFQGKHSSSGQYEAYVRNISASGISFVHGVYVYPETPCSITINTQTGEQQCISAVVTRCRHVTGMIHEIGAAFESEIEIEEFVDSRIMNTRAEITPPDISKASGTVLIIDDSLSAQRLIQHSLKESALSFSFASDGETALSMIEDFPTVVICDVNLPDANGLDLMLKFKETGYSGPILIVTGEEDPEIRATALQRGAIDLIVKPCPPADLRATVAKAIALVDSSPLHGNTPIASTANLDEMPGELILQFVDELNDIADAIESNIEPLDKAALREKALMVKSSALGYGFAPLTHAASTLVRAIDEESDPQKISDDARVLLSTCRRATTPVGWEEAA